MGSIFTVRYRDSDTDDLYGNVTLEIVGLGSAVQQFVVNGDQVRTNPSLRLNCQTDYQLIIRATDGGGNVSDRLFCH